MVYYHLNNIQLINFVFIHYPIQLTDVHQEKQHSILNDFINNLLLHMLAIVLTNFNPLPYFCF